MLKASSQGHYQVVSLLINHSRFNSINEKDILGRTALHEGEYSNLFKLIILLILLFKALEKSHSQIVNLISLSQLSQLTSFDK